MLRPAIGIVGVRNIALAQDRLAAVTSLHAKTNKVRHKQGRISMITIIVRSRLPGPRSRPACCGAARRRAGTDLRQLDAGARIPERQWSCRTCSRLIEKETNGAIKWKLIPGGQLADGKTTFTAVKDGLIQAGLAIPTYVPNTVPALFMIYSTVDPRPERRGGRDRRGAGDHLFQLPGLPRRDQEAERGVARRLDHVGLSAGLHHAGEVARRPEGQACPRHRRQRRHVQDGGRRAGRRHAGRGREPAAARRSRLPARHRRLAAHLRLCRLRQIRHRHPARPHRARDRLLS